MQAQSWSARYVLEFLNAYLKKNAHSREFLTARPASNGVPAHMITADVRMAKRSVPSLEAYSVELHAKGFAQAIPLYQARKQAGDPVPVTEQELNRWGYRLLQGGQAQDGLEIFKLMAYLFPDSWNAHDSLGEAYAVNKDTANAIAHYQRSLQLEPNNINAAEALKTLSKASR
jgi:tetratricopeptide (TPR) repeat protein